MLYGVPYELFWHLNPRKLEPFKTAFQKRIEMDDYNAWMLGSYIRAAVGSVLDGKRCKYPEKPLGASAREGENDRLSAENKFILWVDAFNRGFEGEKS